MFNDYSEAGARFSPDRRFRYELWRTWDSHLPPLVFVMLNPSSGGEDADDPTIRKCVGFAQRTGLHGGIRIVNLFSRVATDPADLYREGFPTGGAEHFYWLGRALSLNPNSSVLAWGAWQREPIVRRQFHTLRDFLIHGGQLRYRIIGRTKQGFPLHPLMVPYSNGFTWVRLPLLST